MQTQFEQLTKVLKAQIQNYEQKIQMDEVGQVISIADDVAHIYGLDNCVSNELLLFPHDIMGIAMRLEQNCVIAIILGDGNKIQEGDTVKRTREVISVPVGEALLGRVVNALGEPIDGKGMLGAKLRWPIEREAPAILNRKSVHIPLQTGIKAIDAMVPIGRGQRELIIGDRQTGKTSLALDTIIHQKNQDMICIYVAIGQKQSNIAAIEEQLRNEGALQNTIMVVATASDSASMQYIVPYSACTMGEYFMEQGKNVLIIYDDLSKHAVAYRTISLLIKRPPGREAYPGDVFYLHSRLLERSAQLSDEQGSGSLTALPIVETQGGDVSAYIPTNVISITDGQLFLESKLFQKGIIPAVDPGISVSRVGGNAQLPAMRKVSSKLKLIYSQYQELADFAQFGSDLDAETQKNLAQGERIIESLKQAQNQPISVPLQICLFYTVINTDLSALSAKDMHRYEQKFYELMLTEYADLLSFIAEGNALRSEDEAQLQEIAEIVRDDMLFSLEQNK